MKRGALLLVAAVVGVWLAAFAVTVAARGPRTAAELHTAPGYAATVDLLIRHRWLRYDPEGQRVEVAAPEGSAVWRFVRSSYLGDDIAAFNAGDPTVFRVVNGQLLAIDPDRHNVLLPFAELERWRGDLSFRPEPVRRAELRGRASVLTLLEPSASLRDQARLPEVRLAPGDAAPRAARAEALSLLSTDGVYFGKTHLVGDTIVFNHRGSSPRAELSVSGQPLPPGNRLRLAAGDLLKLAWRVPGAGGHYVLLRGGIAPEAPLISAFRPVNGRARREPDAPEPRLGGGIVRAMDADLRRAGGAGRPWGADEVDLALTLDAELHRRTQAILEAACRGLRAPGEPPFRAAAAIMDTRSGELLALASYPTPEDVAADPDRELLRNRLLRNHNLARLPVGSVAKVMLTAAILEAAPALADLQIPAYGGGEVESLLGITLDPPLKVHGVSGGEDGWIDLEEYLEDSSNRYAATLLTLAAGADRATGELLPPPAVAELPDELAPADRFRLGGREHERRPRLRVALEPDPDDPGRVRPGVLVVSEHEPFALALQRLFDVSISRKSVAEPEGTPLRRQPWEGDDLVDTSWWRPVLSALHGEDAAPRGHAFYAVAPERENLALNLAHRLRQDYLSVILGGASSTWTTPALCEAMSRLATGRRVASSLVERLVFPDGSTLDPGAERSFAELGMRPEVRRRLMAALTRVVGPSGTARGLHPALVTLARRLEGDGLVLGAFGKTGSPTNLRFVPSRTAAAVDALIRRGALRLDPSGRIVYREAGPVTPDGEAAGSAALAALRAHEGDLALLRRHRVSPRTVVAVAADYNRTPPADRDQFEVERGVLLRMNRVQVVRSTGAAFLATFAAYPPAADSGRRLAGLPVVDVTAAEPERGLTLALVVEGQGPGGEIAVPLAGRLLDAVIAPALTAPAPEAE